MEGSAYTGQNIENIVKFAIKRTIRKFLVILNK